MNGINSVKDAIGKAIVKSKKLKESILKGRWSEVVGEMSKKSTPLYIKEEVLYSLVDGSVFLQHMNMNKSNYIIKANKLLNGNYIKDMRFKVGKISMEEYFHEEEEFITEEFVELTQVEVDEIKNSCNEIENEEIRNKIIHLKEEHLKREKHLSKKGYKKCEECGAFYNKHEGVVCRICENKTSKINEQKIFKMFIENPYTAYEDVKKEIKNLTKENFDKYKSMKLDKIYRRAHFYVVEKREDMALEELENYLKIENGNKNEHELEAQSWNLLTLLKEKLAEV